MKVKRDQITGLVLVILGAVVFIMASQFKKPLTAEYPGPKLMPFIAAFGLVVCGMGIFVKGCKQKEADKLPVNGKGMIRIVVTFAVLCLYIFGMRFLGFLIVTPFLVFGLTLYFAKASGVEVKIWVAALFALAVTGIIWAMYVPLFGMELPVGELFE